MKKFYEWGNNMRILKISEEEAIRILDQYSPMTKEEYDDFWCGYQYGQDEKLVNID